MRRNAIIAILLAAPISGAAAQHISGTLDAGGTNLRYADTISATGLTLTPALAYESGLSTVGLRATVSQFDQYVKLNKKIPQEVLTSL